MVEKILYGKLEDGREVYQYTLKNSNGMVVKIINYGAIITHLFVKDKENNFEDVVLGFDSLEEYVKDDSYFGSIVGRYGNRIGKGKFKLDGEEYQLSINNGKNHLHGGVKGFNKVLWDAEVVNDEPGSSLRLSYVSPDGEEGYPGTVRIAVTYSLTDSNELKLSYSGETEKATIINPTHHSYFNLTGDFSETILNHELQINADKFTPVDEGLITTGELKDVENTPMDFRKGIPIVTNINDDDEQIKYGGGFDHNWVLNGHDSSVKKAVSLYEPQSGRLMEVYTDQPGIQFYSGNFLNGSVKGKNGVSYNFRTGLCLEAQHFPDSPNKPDFPAVVLRPGEEYRQVTVYRFLVR